MTFMGFEPEHTENTEWYPVGGIGDLTWKDNFISNTEHISLIFSCLEVKVLGTV